MRNLKTAFFTLIVLTIIFTSCTENPSIKGVWRLDYEIQNGKSIPSLLNSRLLDFSVDSLKMIEFDNNTGSGDVEIRTINAKYLRTGDVLTIHDEQGDFEMIALEAGDSLVWSYADTNRGTDKYVYRRLVSNSKTRVTPEMLVGKSFTVENKFYHDSLSFIDNEVALETGEYAIGSPAENWELVSYKEFDFLMFLNPFWNMQKINVSDNQDIYIQDNPKSTRTDFTVAVGNLTKDDFVGEWEEVFNTNPLPYFGDPESDIQLENVTLVFSPDSMTMEYRGKSFSRLWNLTTDSKRIYFPNHLTRTGQFWWFQNGSWKIIDKTETELTLTVFTQVSVESDTVILKRIKPAI